MSIFVTETQNILNSAKDDLFDFRNQLAFLDNIEVMAASPSRTRCSIAFTNLKGLLFYSPNFKMISSLTEYKIFPNSVSEKKFKEFWGTLYSDQFEMIEKKAIITIKKNNVKRYLRVLVYVLMFFVNMKIAHRRKLRAMEMSDDDDADAELTEKDLKSKRKGFFRKKKKIDSVSNI